MWTIIVFDRKQTMHIISTFKMLFRFPLQPRFIRYNVMWYICVSCHLDQLKCVNKQTLKLFIIVMRNLIRRARFVLIRIVLKISLLPQNQNFTFQTKMEKWSRMHVETTCWRYHEKSTYIMGVQYQVKENALVYKGQSWEILLRYNMLAFLVYWLCIAIWLHWYYI